MVDLDTTGQAVRDWERVFPDEDFTVYALMVRLIRGGRIAESTLSPGAAAGGLEVAGDYEVLAALRRAHPAPLQPVSISTRVMTSAPGITGRLDRLERVDLIERHPHPTDRRATLVHLTEDGLQAAERAFGSMLAEMRRLAGSLAPAELKRVASCLHTVLVAFGDVPDPGRAEP